MYARRSLGERGAAFVTTIILSAVLLTVAVASMIYSRSDAMVSSHSESGSEALWIAHLGAERVKDWLRKYDPAAAASNWESVTTTVVRHNAETYSGQAGATYTTTVAPFGAVPGRFLIDSTGTAPDASSARIQEVVALAGASLNADAINIQGIGTHTKIAANNMGIPKYFIDARDHDLHGTPCRAGVTPCPASMVAAISGTPATLNNDVRQELTRLRHFMAADAQSDCNTSGSNCNGPKQSGLYFIQEHWIGSQGMDETMNPISDCNYGDGLPCPTAMDLTDARLNAVQHTNDSPPNPPVHADTAWAVDATYGMFVGPIVGSPETKELSVPEDQALQALIEQLLEFALESDVSSREAITTDLTSSRTFGTWEAPVVAIVCDTGHPNSKMAALSNQKPCNGVSAPNNLNVDAPITGTGLLIVSRALLVDDAVFNWRGIVLILDEGRFEVKATGGSADVCGMILGTVIIQDDTGADPKIKFLDTANTTCANPFASEPTPGYTLPTDVGTLHGFGVKYSSDSIKNALSPTLTTVAWHEIYTGE